MNRILGHGFPVVQSSRGQAGYRFVLTRYPVAVVITSYSIHYTKLYEEPCNFVQKFPRPNLVIDTYLNGETLIESYWKSVEWPGQGIFIGEPLATPFLPD